MTNKTTTMRSKSSAPSPEELAHLIGWAVEQVRRLDDPPAAQADNQVDIHFTGAPLAEPIYWQGRQWAVTAYGVECRDGTYAIEDFHLLNDESLDEWIRHMAPKWWVDFADFVEAVRLARKRALIAPLVSVG